tara:strand:- start:2906 stop:3268 length:363 start_codon:yes stop_codon:yes gene_type:complete
MPDGDSMNVIGRLLLRGLLLIELLKQLCVVLKTRVPQILAEPESEYYNYERKEMSATVYINTPQDDLVHIVIDHPSGQPSSECWITDDGQAHYDFKEAQARMRRLRKEQDNVIQLFGDDE